MYGKIFLILTAVLSGLPVFCQKIDWETSGNVTKIASGSFGDVYKVECNKIQSHGAGDSLNAVSLSLFENRKAYKKEKSRFLTVEYFLRMYPFATEYSVDYRETLKPFASLGIGFTNSIKTPTTYQDLNLFVSGVLYYEPWTVYAGWGIQNIGKMDQRKKFPAAAPLAFFYQTSVFYAPVHMIFCYDRKEDVLSFYLNGILQNTICLKGVRENKKFGSVSLVWQAGNRKRKKKKEKEIKIFELSEAKVHFHNEPRKITPGFINPPGKNAKHYDSNFEQALSLLYSPENDWKRGFELLKKVAEQGHAPAIYELARCYYRGIGCSPDTEKTMECLEKASELCITEAASMRLVVAGLLPLTPELDKRYVRGAFNTRNDGDLLWCNSLDRKQIIVVKNNSAVFARSLDAILNFVSAQQKPLIQKLLKEVADSGDPLAMSLYALSIWNKAGERDACYEKAFAQKEPSAIRYFVLSKKRKFESLDLERQLSFAKHYPIEFAGSPDSGNREKILRELHFDMVMKKNPKAAVAYSEALLRPYWMQNKKAKESAEQSMALAAEQLPVAQVLYVLRYLDGMYGTASKAQHFLSLLKKSHGEQRIVKELDALLLEKVSPGKQYSLWKQLEQEGSVPALYYLGEYADRQADKNAAAAYRRKFLEKDRICDNFASRNIFESNKGQFFGGCIELP